MPIQPVGDLIGDLSDHCLISFVVAVSVTIQQPHMKPRCASAPTKYKWHERAESQIRDLLDCHIV